MNINEKAPMTEADADRAALPQRVRLENDDDEETFARVVVGALLGS